MTPSIPAGKYVSRDIRPTRAGSELEEQEKNIEVLAKNLQGSDQTPYNSEQDYAY